MRVIPIVASPPNQGHDEFLNQFDLKSLSSLLLKSTTAPYAANNQLRLLINFTPLIPLSWSRRGGEILEEGRQPLLDALLV